ncbi:MAG TPA: hypothetical protein VN853_19570 [Polyangia bacterium]|jgi:uncharacterized protein YceK|nr:hypothetical protein [Polyangia bacterium]
MKEWIPKLALFGALGIMTVSGCATAIHGTAPAGNGSLYAVGSRNNMATAWICPATPTKAECQQITVQETEK